MSQDLLRALESIRRCLQNLSTSLTKLRHDLETTDPLPSWPSIQASLQLIQHGLLSLHVIESSAKPILQAAHVYPLPAFPGRVQEELLAQLLRKKLQPGVEDWITQGQKLASLIPGLENATTAALDAVEENMEEEGLKVAQLDELWNWAGPEANRIAREDVGAEGWDDVFTLAESEAGIENVVTGLRRKLWESEDEESDDDQAQSGTGNKKEDPMDLDRDDDDAKKNNTAITPALAALDNATRIMMTRKIDETRASLPLEAILRYQLTGQPPTVSVGGAQVRR